MSAEHTPTPWAIVDSTEIISTDEAAREEFGVIADTNLMGPKTEQQAADTDFIVRCVNAHDELVAALEAVEKAIDDYPMAVAASLRGYIKPSLARARGCAESHQADEEARAQAEARCDRQFNASTNFSRRYS